MNLRVVAIKIKNARERLGWSQRRLAEEAGLSAGYIGSIESADDDVKPSLNALDKIAKALNVTTSFLLEVEQGILVDDYKEHLSLKEKQFIAQSENKDWITLSEEFANKKLTPEKVRKLVRLAMELTEENS